MADVEFTRPTELESQPVTVEILTEKDGIVGELEQLAFEFGCRLTVARGFTGKSLASEILSRAITDGRPLVVLMFHDADTAGESMGIATARHLEFLACKEQTPPVLLEPVGITLAQVEEIEQEIGREIPRAPDSRAEGRVELDALPEFAPGWIERELRRHLEQVWARVDYGVLDAAEEHVERQVTDRYRQREMEIEQIVGEGQRLLDTPGARALREQFQALQDRLDDLDDLEADDEVELPDPQVAEPDLDAVDWLLDTRREYVEQLNKYRRREPVHRRRPELELHEREGCVGCGRDMRGRATTARFCDNACKQRHRRENRR